MRDKAGPRGSQAHELGGFVKRFARRVVNGFAQNFVAAPPSTLMSWVWPPDTSSATKGIQAGRHSRRAKANALRGARPARACQRRAQGAGHARAHQQGTGQAWGPWV